MELVNDLIDRNKSSVQKNTQTQNNMYLSFLKGSFSELTQTGEAIIFINTYYSFDLIFATFYEFCTMCTLH